MALDTPTTTVEASADTDETPVADAEQATAEPTPPVTATPPHGPRLSPSARFALVVLAAVLVGFGLRLAIGLTDDAPATDETAYLRSALSLAEGEGFERNGRPEMHFPPLVPFLLSLTSKVFDDPHDGTILLTALASTLIIVPLALLGRRAAGRTAGMVTAWVAALAPGLSTTLVNRGAGSEAEYTLLVVSALWLLASAADRRGWQRLALTAGSGLCIGLAYLTRPEGLFVAVPLGLGLLLLAVRELRNGGRLRTAIPVLGLFGLPILICVVPYMKFLHDSDPNHKWQLSAKTQDASIEAWRGVAENDRHARDQVLYALDETGLTFSAGRTSLPGLAREDPGGYLAIVGVNVTRFVEEIVGPERGQILGWLLLPLPLWGLAAYGAWRFRASRTVRLLLAVAALPVATTLAFFVQPRYLIVLSALATVLVGAAISTMSRRWMRPVLVGTVVLLAASCVQSFHGGGRWWHPYDQTDQRITGEWLAANTDPDDRIMTRSMVIEFYAERPTMAIPYADPAQILTYGRHYCAQYLVLDWYTVTRLRPQLKPLHTQDEWPGLKLVHEVTAEGRSTRVFALDPPPEGECAPIGASLGFVGDGPPAAEG